MKQTGEHKPDSMYKCGEFLMQTNDSQSAAETSANLVAADEKSAIHPLGTMHVCIKIRYFP